MAALQVSTQVSLRALPARSRPPNSTSSLLVGSYTRLWSQRTGGGPPEGLTWVQAFVAGLKARRSL